MKFSFKLTLFLSACLLLIIGCGNAAKPRNLTPSADPREDLVKATKALSNAKSYRAKYVISGSVGAKGGMKTVMDIEFVAPDRYHAIGEMTFGTPGNGKVEIIVLGNDTYMRVKGGQWQKTQNDLRKMVTEFNNHMIENLANAEVSFIGNDTLDGLPMLVYQHAFKNVPKEAGKNRTKTWVGVNDGLPHKIEVLSEINYQGDTYDTNVTTTYSDFNTDIKIEPPM